jgi:hypothetical protein
LWHIYGILIEDAKIILHSFHTWSVGHIKREANMAVHALSKAAIQTSTLKIRLNEYPEFIHDIVIANSCNF